MRTASHKFLCVKSVQIRSYSWSVFLFGLSAGKYIPEITPYPDTFHAVLVERSNVTLRPNKCN